MIDLADLGLKTSTPTAEEATALTVPAAADDEFAPGPLVPGATATRALYEAWRGSPFILVGSPPGAGKTTLVVDVVHRLSHATDLRIRILAPTLRACKDMAIRLAEKTGPGIVRLAGKSFARDDFTKHGIITENFLHIADPTRTSVLVQTVASARMIPPESDILVFDEAYQSTFGDALAASANAASVLMVGDPGQIGPVVTLDDGLFLGRKVNPIMRAPEGFSAHLPRQHQVHLSLPSTYRLGAETTKAIAPLYPFTFDSKRPPVTLDGYSEIESLIVPDPDSVSDRRLISAVTGRVESLVGTQVRTADGSKRTLHPSEIAVVASRNEQTAAIEARLSSLGLDEVAVGTADRLQGGQWLAVVALDPITGADVASAHALETGRLCVMASRHIAHLTWITQTSWQEVLANSLTSKKEIALHTQVRQALGCH